MLSPCPAYAYTYQRKNEHLVPGTYGEEGPSCTVKLTKHKNKVKQNTKLHGIGSNDRGRYYTDAVEVVPSG